MSKISELLSKFKSTDNDFRYMAVNDLMDILNDKGNAIDDQSLQSIAKGLMALIIQKDSISEVKNISIKCLALVSAKANDKVIEILIYGLIDLLKSKKGEERDLAELGLKGVIVKVPFNTKSKCKVLREVYSEILEVLKHSQDHESKLSLLEILSDTITRLGGILFEKIEGTDSKLTTKTLDILYPLIKESRISIVKRTYITLGNLSIFLSDSLFNELVNRFISEFNRCLLDAENEKNVEQLKTIVLGFLTLSKTDTVRFSEFLNTVYDLIQSLSPLGETFYETTLQAHESFILNSPVKMVAFKDGIISNAVELLSYDPNYVDLDDDDAEMDEDFDNDMDDEFEEEFDNTDDESWKTRRSSARLLKAIILSYPDLSVKFYEKLSDPLVNRFSEREEMVRVDVFETFIVLIQQTFGKDLRVYGDVESPFEDYISEKGAGANNTKRRKVHSPQRVGQSDSQTSARQLALQQLPKIVNRVEKYLNLNFIATKQVSLKLLKELNDTLPDIFSEHIPTISKEVNSILDGSQTVSNQNFLIGSNIRLDGLQFLKSMLRYQTPVVVVPHIEWICPIVVNNLSNNLSSYSSEAIALCSELIKLLSMLPQEFLETGGEKFSKAEYLTSIHQALLDQVNDIKLDNSIRESGIQLLGYLFYSSGLAIQPQFLEYLDDMLIKLDSNFSKASTQSLTHALTSQFFTPKSVGNEAEVLEKLNLFIPPLTANLNKVKQQIGVHSLVCLSKVLSVTALIIDQVLFALVLDSIVAKLENYGSQNFSTVMDILLLSVDSELSLPILQDNLAKLNAADIFNILLRIELSSVVQLESAVKLAQFVLQFVISSHKAGLDGREVGYSCISKLMDLVHQPDTQLSDQSCTNLALLCSYVVEGIATFDSSISIEFVSKLSKDTEASVPVNQRRIALQGLGKLALNFNFANQFDLFSVAITAFGENIPELRMSAAIALGSLVSSNLSLMPKLIQQIDENQKHRYLLLRSFKEIVNCFVERSEKQVTLNQYGDDLWNFLVTNSTLQSDAATRYVAAECLGKLIILDPKYIVQLRDLTLAPAKISLALAITAIRYSIHNDSTSENRAFTSNLKPYLSDFLECIRSADLEVRRLTVTTVMAIAHHKPQLLVDILPNFAEALEEETKVKPELVRSIVVGPSTHRVDDGLENRKAAYECYYNLLDTLPSQLRLDALLQVLVAGIQDLNEVKILTHLLVTRLIKVFPNYVQIHVNQLAIPLIEALNAMPKNALKTDENSYTELIRSTLRLLDLLVNLDAQKPTWFNSIFTFQEAEQFKSEFPSLAN